MKWCAVDPGISGTGFALFEDDKLLSWQNIYSDCSEWDDKCVDIYINFVTLKRQLEFEKMFIEWPSNFMGSSKGQVAISTGSLLKLCYLIGALASKFSATLIPVVKWKGQLKKNITKKRAEKFFKMTGFKSHAADAVAMGMYCIQERLWTTE